MFAGTLFMRKHHTVKCDYSGEDETIEHVFMFYYLEKYDRRSLIQKHCSTVSYRYAAKVRKKL